MSQLTDEIEALCALEPLPDSPRTILRYAADTYTELAGASAAVSAEPSTPLYTALVTTDDADELVRQLVCAASHLAREGR